MTRFHISLSTAMLGMALIACTSTTWACDRPAASDTAECRTQLNKATARRVFEEGLSQGRFEVPYTADFVGHSSPTTTFTHAQGMAEARNWRTAFPDLNVTVDLIVAESDLVSVRWTARGTNTAAGNGIPATGKRANISGTAIFRFVDGAIAEEWTSGDSLGLMKQLGLLPKRDAAK